MGALAGVLMVPLSTAEMSTVFSGKGIGIWVMSEKGKLYVGNHVKGMIHHSSFLAGANVIGDGRQAAGRFSRRRADWSDGRSADRGGQRRAYRGLWNLFGGSAVGAAGCLMRAAAARCHPFRRQVFYGHGVEELRANVLEAISVHFEDGPVSPRLVQLHYVKDELIKRSPERRPFTG